MCIIIGASVWVIRNLKKIYWQVFENHSIVKAVSSISRLPAQSLLLVFGVLEPL